MEVLKDGTELRLTSSCLADAELRLVATDDPAFKFAALKVKYADVLDGAPPGLANYYRRFVEGYAEVEAPPTALCSKRGRLLQAQQACCKRKARSAPPRPRRRASGRHYFRHYLLGGGRRAVGPTLTCGRTTRQSRGSR